LQDLRALQTVENQFGRAAALALLEENLAEPLTFKTCPHDAAWLLHLRERIYAKLEK
jgi:hypothetical protein